MELCYETSLSNNPLIAGKAIKIITQINCFWQVSNKIYNK